MKEYYDVDPRKERRHFRRMGYTAVQEAWDWGQYAATQRKKRRNPYPPGKRHDEWNRGYDMADPLGDYHGRNE